MLTYEQIRDELRQSASNLTEHELHMLAATAYLYAEAGRQAGWKLERDGLECERQGIERRIA